MSLGPDFRTTKHSVRHVLAVAHKCESSHSVFDSNMVEGMLEGARIVFDCVLRESKRRKDERKAISVRGQTEQGKCSFFGLDQVGLQMTSLPKTAVSYKR